MTNAEAVNWLINITADIGKAEHSDLWHYEQALSEIREMLEDAQPETHDKRTETHACDCISRQVALDAIDTWDKFGCGQDGKLVRYDDDKHYVPYVRYEDMVHAIKHLPSAQPQRMKGRWIYGEHDIAMCDGYRCDKCGFFVPWDYKYTFIDFINDYHFCPNCGSDMRGEDDEAD